MILMPLGGRFDLDSKMSRIMELESLTQKEGFWDNSFKAGSIMNELNSLKEVIEEFNVIDKRIKDVEELVEDDNSFDLVVGEVLEIVDRVDKLFIDTYLDGPYDNNDVILEIHPGAGGTESCDWALMLYRMYLRYAEKNDFKVEELSKEDGDEAGLKSVSIMIKGTRAYGLLKGEKGVHRLVRISPFDSKSRRHTSFASIDITPVFGDDIFVDVKDEELKIDVYRSSGAGGQSVNTTDSAVRITHLPSKIVVTCQNERSQIKNKEKALSILKNKLYQLEVEKKEEELSSLKGEQKEINFGSQIRSYTLYPYKLVKDHRTGAENTNANAVLDGDIDKFIDAYIKGERK